MGIAQPMGEVPPGHDASDVVWHEQGDRRQWVAVLASRIASPRQLHVFDAIDRDERGRVLSVAHVALVRGTDVVPLLRERSEEVSAVPADDVQGLPWDHDDIVRRAVADVRQEYALRPDPMGLLGEAFALRELFELHLSIAAAPGPGEGHLSSTRSAATWSTTASSCGRGRSGGGRAASG